MTFNNCVITGTGSFVPPIVKTNSEFSANRFYDDKGQKIKEPIERTISKFQKITDIEERRYSHPSKTCSHLATQAALEAIENAQIDAEELNYIIVAHNFGDVINHTIQSDMVPSLAARVKHNLGIENPNCVAYDVLFGCPGWIEGVIQASAFMKAGLASKCLVIGAEALSRVLDPHDRDSMIFADGAGAAVLELKEEKEQRGVLNHASQSFIKEEMPYLYLGKSNYPGADDRIRYIKMQGRKIYEFALSKVPQAMYSCVQEADISPSDIKKVLIHQANHKMDEAIIGRFFDLMNHSPVPDNVMPMTIDKFGNSSVATIPTLYDLILRNQMPDHEISAGDYLMFASVGAGMNINCFMYKQ